MVQVDEGIPVRVYQIYAHLQRHGMVVRRQPCLWQTSERSAMAAHAAWQATWPDSATVARSHKGTPLCVSNVVLCLACRSSSHLNFV
jgi:hypothetical protein